MPTWTRLATPDEVDILGLPSPAVVSGRGTDPGQPTAAANDRMTAALADTDLAGYERVSLSFDAAERRFDVPCGAACEAGYYLGFASVPDKPAKVTRFTRRDRFRQRPVAWLRRPIRAVAVP